MYKKAVINSVLEFVCFREVRDKATKIARLFMERGYKKGDVIAIGKHSVSCSWRVYIVELLFSAPL